MLITKHKVVFILVTYNRRFFYLKINTVIKKKTVKHIEIKVTSK